MLTEGLIQGRAEPLEPCIGGGDITFEYLREQPMEARRVIEMDEVRDLVRNY